MTTLSVRLPGTWKLLSRRDRTLAGEERTEPTLGADPVALLIYDRAGHFAAQFMKRDRSALAPEPVVAATNNSRARDGYDAYFGTYTIDEAAGTVTQRLVGALSSENVDLVVTRRMHVEGDTLVISLETSGTGGEALIRTLTWTRVG